jgi:hypothetical protein
MWGVVLDDATEPELDLDQPLLHLLRTALPADALRLQTFSSLGITSFHGRAMASGAAKGLNKGNAQLDLITHCVLAARTALVDADEVPVLGPPPAWDGAAPPAQRAPRALEQSWRRCPRTPRRWASSASRWARAAIGCRRWGSSTARTRGGCG